MSKGLQQLRTTIYADTNAIFGGLSRGLLKADAPHRRREVLISLLRTRTSGEI